MQMIFGYRHNAKSALILACTNHIHDHLILKNISFIFGIYLRYFVSVTMVKIMYFLLVVLVAMETINVTMATDHEMGMCIELVVLK